MHIELNTDTEFSIGDTIYYMEMTNNGVEIKSDEVDSIDFHFYKGVFKRVRQHIIYTTRNRKRIYEGSCWATAKEAKAQARETKDKTNNNKNSKSKIAKI